MDSETHQVLQEYAEEIRRLNREVNNLKRGTRRPQLAHSSLEEGQSVEVRDDDGNVRTRIGWQPDGTAGLITEGGDAPPAPTEPTVEPSLGGLRVTWDGAMANDQAKPGDLSFVQVHVSTTSGFTPDDTTRAGSIPREGGMLPIVPLPYEQHHVRLVGVTTGGITGDPSTEATATPVQVDEPDLTAGSVTAAHIQAGAITADLLEAVLTLASRVVAGDPNAARVELNSDGLRAYNSSEELTVSIDAADGNAVYSGTITGSDITGSDILLGDLADTYVHIYTDDGVSGSTGYIEATSAGGASVYAESTNAHANLYMMPPDEEGEDWQPARMRADVGSGVPHLRLDSPRDSDVLSPASSIRLYGNNSSGASPFASHFADLFRFSLTNLSSQSDAVVEINGDTSILSSRHRYVQATWLGVTPSTSTSGTWTAFTTSEYERPEFRTGASGAVRVTINLYGVNAATTESVLSVGFEVGSISPDRSRCAEIRSVRTSDPYWQQCSVVYIDLDPNTDYTLTPHWRLSSGTWGSDAVLGTSNDNSITVEPLM